MYYKGSYKYLNKNNNHEKTIITTSMLALFVGSAMAAEVSNDVISKTGSIHGGYVSGKSDITIADSSYDNISLTANGGQGNNAVVYGGIAYVNNGTGTTNTISNSTFSNISVSAYWQGQGTAVAVDGSNLSVDNSSFLNNTTSTEVGVYGIGSMGGAIAAFNSNTTISNSTFDGNKSLGAGALWGYGGAVYAKSSNVSISNSILKNNVVSNDSVYGAGGAIYLQTNSNLSITDTEITGNVATYGGAIQTYNSFVNINVSADKSLSYSGNKAYDDECGGFAYMSSSSATFNVGKNATLSIGDGTAGYDSVVGDASSTINKTGAGALVVNGSMKYYTGALNVNAGTMGINNGLGANRVVVAKDSAFNTNNWTVENQTVAVEGASSVLINGGILNTKGASTLNNVSFKNNTFTTTVDNSTGANSGVFGGVVQISNGSISIDGGEITGNTMTAKGGSASRVYGGILYNANSQAETTLKNLTISDNLATGEWNVQGGVISMDNTASTLNIENSVIKNNAAKVVASAGTGFYGAMGGVICSLSATNHNTINVKETTFEGNSATNLITSLQLPYSGGGVAYLKGTMATFTDSTFKGNYVETTGAWDGGGAIYAYNGSVLTFNVSKNDTYAGNYVKTNGVLSNELGGFVRLDGDSTANFNVAENATLTIGDGTAGYDSIAGSASDTINKTGEGALVVNGSMEYFKGVLNVSEGSMTVNSVLGASDIVVADGATLALGDNSNIILYGCTITVEEGGSLELGTNTTITVNLEEDFTGVTNLITVAEGATLTQNGESVTLASLTDTITVTYKGETLDNSQWSFDEETGKLTAAVPEPSTYAMIFGAIALGFVAYRRRK